jgi:hypothetical protein
MAPPLRELQKHALARRLALGASLTGGRDERGLDAVRVR